MPGKKLSVTSRVSHGLRSFEGRLALLAMLSIAAVGPLRGILDDLPPLLFLATLVLFIVPGALLARWLGGDQLKGGALIPVAFTLSVSVYGLLGVPFLLTGLSIEAYLWGASVLLGCFLVVAVFEGFHQGTSVDGSVAERRSLIEWLLWGQFLGLCGFLAYVSRLRTPDIYEDIWVYIAWVREFAGADSLALYEPYFGDRIEGLSRAKINGWLLEQAAISRVSGLDP